MTDFMYEWQDLADSEIRSRLENRGIDPEIARRLVRMRDDPDYAEDLDEFMGMIW